MEDLYRNPQLGNDVLAVYPDKGILYSNVFAKTRKAGYKIKVMITHLHKNGITMELHRRNMDTVGQTAWFDRMDYVVTRAEKVQEVNLSGYKIPIFEDAFPLRYICGKYCMAWPHML